MNTLVAIGRFALNVLKTTARYTWNTVRWVSGRLLDLLQYLGRCSLWIIFLPLGIFRSWLHHSRK